MKVAAVTALRAKLSAGEAVHGMWITTEAIAVTEIAVGLGLEYVWRGRVKRSASKLHHIKIETPFSSHSLQDAALTNVPGNVHTDDRALPDTFFVVPQSLQMRTFSLTIFLIFSPFSLPFPLFYTAMWSWTASTGTSGGKLQSNTSVQRFDPLPACLCGSPPQPASILPVLQHQLSECWIWEQRYIYILYF